MNRKIPCALAGFLAAVMLVCGCGGAGVGTPPPVITVAVAPTSASVRAGSTQTFTATVTGTTNTSVTWQVNNIAGGNSTIGTIDASGNYLAPAVVPAQNSVTVSAVSVASSSSSGSSPVTLMNPIPVVTAVNPNAIVVGAFSLTVTGSGFVSGAQVMFGGAAMTTIFVSSTQLTATGTATTSQVGSISVTVNNPNPGAANSTTSASVQVSAAVATTAPAAVRFLEQSTFGPTSALIAQVQASGFIPFLNSQFAAAQSTYPDPAVGVTINHADGASFLYERDDESGSTQAAGGVCAKPDICDVECDRAAAGNGAIYANAFRGRVYKLSDDYAGRDAIARDGLVLEYGE